MRFAGVTQIQVNMGYIRRPVSKTARQNKMKQERRKQERREGVGRETENRKGKKLKSHIKFNGRVYQQHTYTPHPGLCSAMGGWGIRYQKGKKVFPVIQKFN